MNEDRGQVRQQQEMTRPMEVWTMAGQTQKVGREELNKFPTETRGSSTHMTPGDAWE